MDKLIKDGMVAVLYSVGYGAGWYTWNSQCVDCIFDPQIARLVIAQGECDEMDEHVAGRIEKIAKEKWDGFYAGGAIDLQVEWVRQGEQFEIDVYDGAESVNIIGECQYLVA